MRNYEDHVLWRKAYKAQYKGGQLMEGKDWDHLLGDCEAVLDQYAAGMCHGGVCRH